MDHVFGKHRGLVVDNADPMGLARLRVAVPWLDEASTMWALPCVPYAPAPHVVLPPVGSNVWVEFERGDVTMPIWSGVFWLDSEAPSPEDST